MQLNGNIEKFELYIVSLWFLFFLIIVVSFDAPVCFGEGCQFIGFWKLLYTNIVSFVSLILLLFGVVYYYRFDHRVSGAGSIPARITKIEDVNYEHLTFLTTYIIPLICFNLTNFRYVLALTFLLAVIGVIYVKTDKFYANPTLAVLGFKVYKVNLETRLGPKESVILISRKRLTGGDRVSWLCLDEKVYFARKVSDGALEGRVI